MGVASVSARCEGGACGRRVRVTGPLVTGLRLIIAYDWLLVAYYVSGRNRRRLLVTALFTGSSGKCRRDRTPCVADVTRAWNKSKERGPSL